MATTRVDRFGRIVIPKPIRDSLGLDAGAELKIAEEGGSVILTRIVSPPVVRLKGHVPVHTGKAEGDLVNAVRRDREERIRKVSGMDES